MCMVWCGGDDDGDVRADWRVAKAIIILYTSYHKSYNICMFIVSDMIWDVIRILYYYDMVFLPFFLIFFFSSHFVNQSQSEAKPQKE